MFWDMQLLMYKGLAAKEGVKFHYFKKTFLRMGVPYPVRNITDDTT